jgi:hypothetical protein
MRQGRKSLALHQLKADEEHTGDESDFIGLRVFKILNP